MKVEVDTAQITELENQIQNVYAILAAIVYRDGGTLEISDADVEAIQGKGVEIVRGDGVTVLTVT